MRYVLGVDLGTSGTKTVLFDEAGAAAASAAREYPMDQPQNGWAEQDPDAWWEAARDTIREILDKSGVKPDRLTLDESEREKEKRAFGDILGQEAINRFDK